MKLASRSPTLLLLGLLFVWLPASEGFLPKSALSRRGSDVRKTNPQNVLQTVAPGGGRSEENKGSVWKHVGRHVVPLSTAVVIGTFSVLEILESSRGLILKWHVQHWRSAHGITLLALIRLGRSIAILQTQAEELEEQVEELAEEKKGNKITRAIANAIKSPVTAIVACLMAAVASIVEIMEDVKPGGHHGAALLALSELYYQIQRLTKRTGTKRKLTPFKFPLGVPIALAAAAFAAMELAEDMAPGGHHGLAVLALAELVENISRSKVIH